MIDDLTIAELPYNTRGLCVSDNMYILQFDIIYLANPNQDIIGLVMFFDLGGLQIAQALLTSVGI